MIVWRESGQEVWRGAGELNLTYQGHGSWKGVQVFVSPTGNGFMVFNASNPDLVRFYDPKGKRVAKFTREELLTAEERDWKERPCACNASQPEFAKMPEYAADGAEVEFAADQTGRKIRFSLAGAKKL